MVACVISLPNLAIGSEMLNSVGSIQAPLAVVKPYKNSELPIARPVIIPAGKLMKVELVTFATMVAASEVDKNNDVLSIDDIDSMDSGYPEFSTLAIGTNIDGEVRSTPKEALALNPALGPTTATEMRISKLQILLDRAGVSPGVINGQKSKYLVHALDVFSDMKDIHIKLDDNNAIDQLIGDAKKELYSYYEITKKDIAGPFVEYIPERIQDQGALKSLTFGSVEEKLAEHFHMDEEFLRRLNPKANFKKVGTKLRVANIGRNLSTKVVSIRANMNSRLLSAYDAKGKIVAIYPASIGSPQNPSPRGTFKVRNKAGFPKYTLSPSNTFEPIDDGLPVIVASGPNNPVGIAWIGLSKKSYGIHGTPWPSRVGEAGSHGCIRLTNWDAMELATLVSSGIEVVIE